MGKVSTGFSMSLDGFIAGPQDDVGRLFQWMTSGDIDITVSKGDGDIELKVPSKSADMFQGANQQIGALVAGRRLFDPLDSPIELESTEVTESTGVTHLTFCVVK